MTQDRNGGEEFLAPVCSYVREPYMILSTVLAFSHSRSKL